MSAFSPNQQQEQAIQHLRGDIVLAAGAGSGKTAVLARRFALAVTGDSPSGLQAEVDSVLTITFTKKAAAELGERVRRVLLEQGERGVALARRVDEGWISTIDAFCSRIVRRHLLELGLDPGTTYSSEVHSAQLRRDAALEVVSRWIEQHGEQGVAGYGTSLLVESVIRDLERLRSMGCTPQELEWSPTTSAEDAAAALIKACDDLRGGIETLGKPYNKTNEQNLLSAKEACRLCSACGGSMDERGALGLLDELASVSFGVRAKPKDEARAARAALEGLRRALGDVALGPRASEYIELLETYAAEYAKRKSAAGVMDFGDAVESVARLFTERPEVAAHYRRHFDLIMIDEFQDTNELQVSAVRPIAGGSMCAVGDVQQSIYGFRYADLGVMKAFETEADTVLPLSMNYRTHPEVLAVVNNAFADEALMGHEFAALEAAREHEYVLQWPAEEPRVEIHALDETLCESGTHAAEEAVLTAQRVKRLVECGAAPDDIVILMRAMTHAPQFELALENQGVPAHLASGEAFFDMREVTDVRTLLRAIAVPQDDQALLGVLAGPLAGLSEDVLHCVALARSKEECLWDGLTAVAKGGVNVPPDMAMSAAAVCDRLIYLREIEGTLSLADLVHQAVHVFDYDLVLLAQGRPGPQAWSNVNKLVRMAAEYERREAAELSAFLDYLEDHERLVAREPVAAVAPSHGAVRIMSIHAAKGLEFPVVVVAGLGRGLVSSTKGRMLVERDADATPRLALRWPADGSTREDIEDSSFERLKERRRRLDYEEEKRILYVALTRAEEALILVGRADPRKHKETGIGLLSQALGLPSEAGIHSVGEGGAEVRLTWHEPPCGGTDGPPKGASAEQPSRPERATTALPDMGSVLDQAAEIICLPDTGRPLPSRLSYTGLHMFDTCPFRFYVRYVLGLSRIEPMESGALSVGTALHMALEQTDPSKVIGRLVDQGELDEEQAARVAGAVEAFTASSLAKKIGDSDRVFRERPFAVRVGDSRLQGKIDLVGYEGDKALIVDYKTGQDREASLAEERQGGYELQSSCYALAVLDGGADQVEVRFVFVEQGCHEISYVYDRDDAEGLRTDLVRRVDQMAEGLYPWLDKRDELLCNGCVAQGLCPHASDRCCLS